MQMMQDRSLHIKCIRSHTRYQEPFNCGTVTQANLHCLFFKAVVQLGPLCFPAGSKYKLYQYRVVYSVESTTLKRSCITDKRLRGKCRNCRPVNPSSPAEKGAVFMTRLKLVVSCLRENISSLYILNQLKTSMIISRGLFYSTSSAELATTGLKQGYLRITGAHSF